MTADSLAQGGRTLTSAYSRRPSAAADTGRWVTEGMRLRRSPNICASYQRPPDVSGDVITGEYFASCVACGTDLPVAGEMFIDKVWRWEEDFTPDIPDDLRRYFEVSITTGKSHDGGEPIFVRAVCAVCRAEHIFYAGVQEGPNSYYRLWIHDVAQAIA
jgi:hypothetical protein